MTNTNNSKCLWLKSSWMTVYSKTFTAKSSSVNRILNFDDLYFLFHIPSKRDSNLMSRYFRGTKALNNSYSVILPLLIPKVHFSPIPLYSDLLLIHLWMECMIPAYILGIKLSSLHINGTLIKFLFVFRVRNGPSDFWAP